MSSALLLDTFPHDGSWARQTWPELAASIEKGETRLAVLTVGGMTDWGMGRPLDLEMQLGRTLLSMACSLFPANHGITLLPPICQAFGTGPNTFFSLGATDLTRLIREICGGIIDSGLKKILFFSPNPWNLPVLDSLAFELRCSHSIEAATMSLDSLGLSLHPRQNHLRRRTQQTATFLYGTRPEADRPPEDQVDTDFRPGRFRQPAPLDPDNADDDHEAGRSHWYKAAHRLASHLLEVAGFPTVLAKDEFSMPWQTAVCQESPSSMIPLPSDSRSLTGLTLTQIQAMDTCSKSIVLAGIGAVEQHGPHLPLGTDSFLADLWVHQLLGVLQKDLNVWSLPTLYYGRSPEHTGFAGTITLGIDVFLAQLNSMLQQVEHWGFGKLVLVSTHGGNSKALSMACTEFQRNSDLRVIFLRPGQECYPAMDESGRYDFHAGKAETSWMLACLPEMVRQDRLFTQCPVWKSRHSSLQPFGGEVTAAWHIREFSENGLVGDAAGANTQLGLDWFEQATHSMADSIRNFAKT